eukprot:TRINITY_DN1323_c0_g1_i1.p1 TRINITY_DN1323_c0_g1~~TRINITY_DN1323_c0_g1_i1.p1  ORF type:complete len:647 (+),score=255.76 TRINITY_DN1323_c0_g1_i1:58-1941(+)
MQRLFLAAALLGTAVLTGAEVDLIETDALRTKIASLGEREGVLVGVADLGSFAELTPMLESVAAFTPQGGQQASVQVYAGDLEELAPLLQEHNVRPGPSYTIVVFTKGRADTMGPEYFEDGEDTGTEVISQWVYSHVALRIPDVEFMKTVDDGEFSGLVYMPSRHAFVMFDTDVLSDAGRAFAEATKRFASDAEAKKIFFVRATPALTPERYGTEMQGVKAPAVKYYGRRKGKYSPVLLDLDKGSDAEFIATWINTQLGPVDVGKMKEKPLPELTDETFTPLVKSVKVGTFVMFHAPWCGHCKRLAPTFEELAKDVFKEGDIVVAKLDATKHAAAAAKFDVNGYPTLLFIDKNLKADTYEGDRSLDDMKRFLYKKLGRHVPGEEPSPALVLTDDNFAEKVLESKKNVFVKFFAPWCGHCKRMAPDWDALADGFAGNDNVVIAKLDGSRYTKSLEGLDVRGFPSLLFFPAGASDSPVRYDGARGVSEMRRFVEKQVASSPPTASGEETAEEGGSAIGKAGEVLELTDKTFVALKTQPKKAMLLMFYAPWCGHCKRLAPDYAKLAEHLSSKFDKVIITRYDAPKYPDLARREGVTSFPTIFYYSQDGVKTKYSGERNYDALLQYVEEQL